MNFPNNNAYYRLIRIPGNNSLFKIDLNKLA